jgi:DNA-binding PadR family transcriptional regulator
MSAPRSPLALLVLLQLTQEPMHVYRMQKLMEVQGKHRVANVRSRASLYQQIERLSRSGLVEKAETVRVDTRPDRTIWTVTESGRVTAREWLREMLRSASADFPHFVAAVSVIFVLDPADAREQLVARQEWLAAELAETHAELTAHPDLPRLFQLEEEYRAALLRAELDWVCAVVDDLENGRLDWSEEWLRQIGEAYTPGEETT